MLVYLRSLLRREHLWFTANDYTYCLRCGYPPMGRPCRWPWQPMRPFK